MAGHNNDRTTERRIAEFRNRLRTAVENRELGEVAERSGLYPDEITDAIYGTDAPDLFLVARLEHALGAELFPRFESRPDIRQNHRDRPPGRPAPDSPSTL